MEPTFFGTVLLASMILAVAGGYGVIAWRRWQVWRRGADARWSTRLKAAAISLASLYAVLVMVWGLTRLLILDSIPALLRGWGFLVPALPAAVCGLAGWIVARVEDEQDRRTKQKLGQAVPPRMAPPGLVATCWLLGTLVLGVAAGTVLFVATWPAVLHSEDGLPPLFGPLLGTVFTGGLLSGTAHTWWQHRRRERARHDAATAFRDQY